MINKVQPINNALDYWHKYRPWAHKYLNHYTRDPDLHGNLDSELWYLLLRILNNVQNYRTLSNYIKESIRGIAKRIKDRLGYKYGKRDLSLEQIDYDKFEPVELNITLDEYLERKAILKYVNRLPSRQAIVPPFNKMSLVEIARETNITPAAIREVKEAGLKRLRRMLKVDGIYNVKDFIYG